MRTLRLIAVFLRTGALTEFQYRINFFLQLFQSVVSLAVGLVGLSLVFSHTTDLAGWTRPELLMVMGVHLFMGGVIRTAVQPNMARLLEDIQRGTFDFALTKPADAQVLISIREFRIWQATDALIGLGVMGVALSELQMGLGLWQALAFLLALICGAVMIYSFWLMLTTVAFWVVRMEEMVNLFEGVYAAGRWPVGVYPDWLRTGLTFLVPVAFAVTVPAEALTNRLTPQTLIGAVLFSILLAVIARLFWKHGLKSYSGASA